MQTPPNPRPRAPRRRVVDWTFYDWWRAMLACGHEVWLNGPIRGKHTRRACRQCGEEGK